MGIMLSGLVDVTVDNYLDAREHRVSLVFFDGRKVHLPIDAELGSICLKLLTKT